jgi:catechol 2,3-dioxygenase-like lactoylglutathione lyase family enzyme
LIDRMTIAASDVPAMVGFYSALLGIRFGEHALGGHTLHVARWAGVELLILPRHVAEVHARDNTIQLRFRVPNVATALRDGVLADGVALGEPEEIAGLRMAAMRDPDGNTLELAQG